LVLGSPVAPWCEPVGGGSALAPGAGRQAFLTSIREACRIMGQLRELGVRKMIYLSDTEPTRVVGLDGYGLSIEGWRPLSETKD
ncbi:MAG: hypothetical protein L3J02_07470, partial [Henriciella sp.]|nr:hypothetical protein [Henriciella sp.]